MELSPGEGLAEGPVGRGDVEGDEVAAVTGGDLEGERLAVEIRVALPILPPVPRHGLPPSPGAFDGDPMHVPCSSNVGD